MKLMFDEFLHGTTIDRNMANLVAHFEHSTESPVAGKCFWEASGLSPAEHVGAFYKKNKVEEGELFEPCWGDYKMAYLN